MFEISEEIAALLNQDYKNILNYCCDCILPELKSRDQRLFETEEISCQLLRAKLCGQLIEACMPLNVWGTGMEGKEINCEELINHYTSSLGNADFRIRWEVMQDEMKSDIHRASTKNRFKITNREPIFIESFFEYRFSEKLYTFAKRHEKEPRLFIDNEQRASDTKSIEIFNKTYQYKSAQM
jgi:hypothetical protein